MTVHNTLLLSLSSGDREKMLAAGQFVELPARARLDEPNKSAEALYFIEEGMASLIYRGGGDRQVDVGLVGREGCTGCNIILGVLRTPQATAMQVQGRGLKVPVGPLHEALDSSNTLRKALQAYVHTVIIQRDETALAASKASLGERLARWLLMAHDRLQETKIPLTHDALSLMLGVRRAGVTTTLAQLRLRGLIRLDRGNISVINRRGLEQLASTYYGAPEREYARLFGHVKTAAVAEGPLVAT